MRLWRRRPVRWAVYLLCCLVSYPVVIGFMSETVILYVQHTREWNLGELNKLLPQERAKLGIPEDVEIELVSNYRHETAYTLWRGPGTPFEIGFSYGFHYPVVLRHELYHIARLLKDAEGMDRRAYAEHYRYYAGTRYWFIEEPLAGIYHATGMALFL